MAARGPSEGQARPEVGDVLMVIHDFQARSSDELTLTKGDRVELIERDDEFGDGWFLGRHLVNNNTGLFPEVYTRLAPRNVLTSAFASSKPLTPLAEVVQEPKLIGTPKAASKDAAAEQSQPSGASKSAPLPLNSVKSESSLTQGSNGKLEQLNSNSQDSHVLHETLNVINEHITDLRSPASNSALRTTAATDSGSEYSMTPLDHRLSYIQGEETDEEEEGTHSRAEVEAWSSDAVAEYLFTSGVEKQHCEVFRDQEISGEVLLGMDQSSLFIKAFDLGSVGRRLKTWHKIKALQDEVNGQGLATRRTTQTYGSEVGSEDARRSRSRTNTLTRPVSISTRRLSVSQTPKASPTASNTPTSQNPQDDANRSSHIKRPSAASVRELHHSRRHSSTDYRLPVTSVASGLMNATGTYPGVDVTHKKQPSFDRNWTLGSAYSTSPRPLSSTGLQDLVAPSDTDQQDSAVDLDRGYFSGTDADGKKRNVLRKRDSGAHSRKSSYAEEQRVRSATAISRHSRFGSMGSIHDGAPSQAAQKYYGIQPGPHRRTASTNTTDSYRPMPPAKDTPAPTVTKLDTSVGNGRPPTSPTSSKHSAFNSDWLAAVVNKPISKTGSLGMRAISDNLGVDRSKAVTPGDSPRKESSIDSPGRTGSTTPSGGRSFDLDSPDATKSPGAATTQASKNNRKKGKKETSAYTRGLEKVPPQEAMKDADYSGWMKKKSSNLMTTWKPRLFILKGRRLSYYYSEDDDQEKGLIDISFHRVLPADNEKLTGLHATITSAVGQSMPVNQSESDDIEKGDDTMFIFKLVPPRAGLSRAVNFTKPTVHYFAVPNLKQGRLWMAALMKATIDRDDTKAITTTYQQKTISLAKAKQMRHRPPALMNLEESTEDDRSLDRNDFNGAGLSVGEADSGVSGLGKLASQKVESANLNIDFGAKESAAPPQSA